MTKATMAMAGLLIWALSGCGSSGGPSETGGNRGTGTGGTAGTHAGGGGGQGGGPGTSCPMFTGPPGSTGTIGWKDNETQTCAQSALADRTTTTLVDTIELDGSGSFGSVSFVLSSYSGPLGGTYSCAAGNGSTIPYVYLAVAGGSGNPGGGSTTSDCSVTISFATDSGGTQHAQGTFSGTVTGDGGTYIVTDGTFDVTVSLIGG